MNLEEVNIERMFVVPIKFQESMKIQTHVGDHQCRDDVPRLL
jgi:hypothetical protein